MKRKYQHLIIMAFLGVILMFNNCEKSKANKITEEKEIFPVRVTTVEKGNVESKTAYLGNLEAYKQVQVYSTIPTRITELKVDVNDLVNAGDVLAVVENLKIRQGLLQSEAGLKSAQAQYENIATEWQRIQKLFEQNAVSKSQYDGIKTQKEAAEAMVNQAKAGMKSAKEQLNDSFIKAPITGIISARNFNIGDQTTPQFPVFTVVQMNKIKIMIDIVEAQILQIQPNQKVYIKVDTYPGEVFVGKVDKKYPTINPMTRTVKCEIVIDNSDLRLKPGGFARVEIVVDQHENVLIVPKHAIIEKTSLEYLGGEIRNNRIIINKYVFVVQDSMAFMREIQTGLNSDNRVEVLTGLTQGETIVTIGQFDISDSTWVNIVEEGK
ncbi:efflux RND transporter periplasmic adaptor subunit [bacterium]|nr:efflux RND transporter periplasmic adaptor subunit [bacterium]